MLGILMKPRSVFHPAVAAWLRELRRADRGAGRGLAGDPAGRHIADRRADRLGQDAGRVPRRDRRAGAAGPRRRPAGRDPGGLRLAAQGAVQRHPANLRAAGRDPRGAARARPARGRDPHLGAHRRHAGARARNDAQRPPHILVTTPESLYILLARRPAARMLATARTVIVDEIHAAGRRQARLAPRALARAARRASSADGRPAQRIGLSATQKPIEEWRASWSARRRRAAEVRDRRHRPPPRARPRASRCPPRRSTR